MRTGRWTPTWSLGTWAWGVFLALVGLVLFGPLVILVVFSFNDSTILALPLSGFTWKWYHLAFTDADLRASLVHSVVVAVIVAPLCAVLGTLSAFGLTRYRFPGRAVIGGLVGAPLVLPWLVIGIAALMAYVKGGISLGMPTAIATQTVCTFPLVTAIVSAQLFRFQRVQEEAALDLGASRWQVLRHVIVPYIAPSLAAGTIFAFTWSFNNYEISAFTLGFQQTFPVWVYSSVRDPQHTAIVNSASTIISVVEVALLWLGLWVVRRRAQGDATALIVGAVA